MAFCFTAVYKKAICIVQEKRFFTGDSKLCKLEVANNVIHVVPETLLASNSLQQSLSQNKP